jgi:hypothetical protein
MARHVHTAYKNEFVKVGQTITVRKPNKFRTTKTQARANTNLSEPSTSVTMSTQAHVSWAFSSVDLTTTIEDYSKRYISPACNSLANTVDYDLCTLYKDIYNYTGTPGTTPSTFKVLGDAQTVLDNEAAPGEGRVAVVNPAANWSLADGLKGTFSPRVATDIITKGYLGTIANLDIYSDQNINMHTTGSFTTGATPLMNGSTTTGATSLVTNGWNGSSSTIAKGDIFTVAATNQVNPVNGISTGILRRWVCTTAQTSNSGNCTIPVSPVCQYGATDPYSTVDALPLTTAPLAFVGTASTIYPQNLVFHPNAFALVTVPIEMPSNVWGARETDPDAGISIRIVKQYDIDADEEICRLDILYGTKTLYPELAVRLWG